MSAADWTGRKLRRLVGRVLNRTDDSGHTLLCRILRTVQHDGPQGTYAQYAHLQLKAGGHLCSYGVWCGEPTESHTRQMHERFERFQKLNDALVKSGALFEVDVRQIMGWPSDDCTCDTGKAEQQFYEHDPLCNYRVQNGIDVTIEEHQAALAVAPRSGS